MKGNFLAVTDSATVADEFRTTPLWWPARVVNAAGPVAESVLRRRLHSLRPVDVVAEAVRRSGRDDLGTDWPEDTFARLCAALDTEAQLTAVGRRFAHRQLVDDVATRIRVVDAVRERPQIAERPVRRPVLMVNLPRSGSTLLQFLLARAPEMRSLWPWEIADPVAADQRTSSEVTAVQRRTRRQYRRVGRLVPMYRRIHPMEVEEPEEVNALLARSVGAFHLGAIYRIPTYVNHLMTVDLRPAYRDLRTQVQLIQGGEPPRTWVLRTPAFVLDLQPLLNIFRDAVVVWLHRDPLTCITSFCSLAATVRAVNSAHVDPTQLGPQWTELWARGVERSLAARAVAPSGVTFLDVNYRELMAQPFAVLDRIRRAVAPDPEPLDEEAIRARIAAGHVRAPHDYRPEWFGLAPGAVRERFAGYVRSVGLD